LKRGATLILAWNYYVYISQPLLVAAWRSSDEIDTKLGKILQGADPPAFEQAFMDLLNTAGFVHPQRFFCSLFWGSTIGPAFELSIVSFVPFSRMCQN
jgi:tRNA (cmo5U34)-methyltransferase